MIEQLQPRGGTEKVFRIMVVSMDACYRPRPSGRKLRLFIRQAVEKVRQLRSRLIEILNVPSEGTPPVSNRLRPCWTAILNSLRAEREPPATAYSLCSPHFELLVNPLLVLLEPEWST
jgi:hypothetical protein